MNRGLPPWQRECMQGTEQAGEMCSGTNTEAEVKNTSWANSFFLARKRTLKLDLSPCFHVETGAAEPPGSTQGSRAEDSYGIRDKGVPALPGRHPRHCSTLPPQAPQAHPSCTIFMPLFWRLYLGSELPTHGSALEKHHTGKSAPHRAQNRLKGT